MSPLSKIYEQRSSFSMDYSAKPSQNITIFYIYDGFAEWSIETRISVTIDELEIIRQPHAYAFKTEKARYIGNIQYHIYKTESTDQVFTSEYPWQF